MGQMIFPVPGSMRLPVRRRSDRRLASKGSAGAGVAPLISIRLFSILVFLSFVMLMLMENSLAIAATRYVDKANSQCSDSGQGTRENPFCTIGRAAATAVAGDTVVVATGVYPEQVTIKSSGTPIAPITFIAAGGGNVTVQGQAYGFYASSRSWIGIHGFTISDTVGYGIYLKFCNHATISNNHVTRAGLPIRDLTAKGIYLYSTTDSLVVGNLADYNSDSGIDLVSGSTRNRVTGNVTAYNARGYTRAAPGIEIRSPANTIDSNICHDNEDSGIQIFTADAINNVITNNASYHNGDHGIDVHGAIGQTIVNNAIYNNVTAGINIEAASTDCTLANNIVVDNGIDSPRTKGNIRVDSGSIPGTTMDYDILYLSEDGTMIQWGPAYYFSLSPFVAAIGMEVHGLEADPLWVSPGNGNFRLLEGSPAIDSANSSVTGVMDVDIKGIPRFDDPATVDTGSELYTYYDRGPNEYQPHPRCRRWYRSRILHRLQ
jgi:parallel beta-helix repeat protein